MVRLTRETLVERLEVLPSETVRAVAVRAALRAVPALSTGSRNWSPFWYWPHAEAAYRALLVLHACSLGVIGACSRSLSADTRDAIREMQQSQHSLVFRSDLRETIGPAALRASHRAEMALSEDELEGRSRGEIRAARRSTVNYIDAAIRALSAAVNASFQPNRNQAHEVEFATTAVARAIAAIGEVRGEVEADLEFGSRNVGLMSLPLWRGGLPAKIARKWETLAGDLQSLDSCFEVWTEWYAARLLGTPLDMDIELRRALIPQEVWAQDAASINSYISQIINSSKLIPLNRVRALFLGHGGAGKTSLIAALHGETVIAGDTRMTPGLDIRDADPHILWRESKAEGGRPAVYFWDFGGQVTAHHTHQFFLRSNCVYVIVLDGRRNNNATDDARYWLEHVRAYGDGSPVLIVGNKIDLDAVSVDTLPLSRTFPNIVGFFPLSCTGAKDTHERAFTNFRREFEAQLRAVAGNQVMLTKEQHDLIASLSERDEGRAFLPRDDYVDLCRKHGINPSGAGLNEEQLLAILDTLGVVVHFRDIRTLDAMLLNPEWLTKGVYTILYSEVGKSRLGRLQFTDVLAALNARPVLDKNGHRLVYDRLLTTFIIDAMRRFKLCYRVPEDEEQLIVPALLADKEPEANEHDFDFAKAWSFRFRFEDFMPEHILPSLIVDRHADIARAGMPSRDLVWKRGMVLRPERYETEAFVVLVEGDRTLTIHINGRHGEDYLGVLRECLRRSLDKMRHLVVKEEVALSHDMRLEDPRLCGALVSLEWAPFAQIQEHLRAGQREYVGPEGGRYSLARINPRLPTVGKQIELLTRIDDIITERLIRLMPPVAQKSARGNRSTAPAQPRHLRIFLSSPGDVAEERQLALDLITSDLRGNPLLEGRIAFDLVSWDDPHASTPMPAHLTPQDGVNLFRGRPSECDIVIVVLWSRIGTPLPKEPKFLRSDGTPYRSGTEYEFEDAMSAAVATGGRPTVLLYRRNSRPEVDLEDPELPAKQEQYRRVREFFERLRNPDGSFRCGFHSYETPEQFRDLLDKHIQSLLRGLIDVSEPVPDEGSLPDLLGAAHNTLLGFDRRSAPDQKAVLARLRARIDALEIPRDDPAMSAFLDDLKHTLGKG